MKSAIFHPRRGVAASQRQLSFRKRLTGPFVNRIRLVGRALLAASTSSLAIQHSLAQEVLRIYSSEGPAPAIREAASEFATNEELKVVSGPPPEWIERATADADVVCASADFMMSAFIQNEALQMEPATVTPLYMRPSAILVRPGNPKRIQDFPDLMVPGVRVMVVTGAGQTGLWEDMAGRKADAQMVRALRRNIAFHAAHNTEAVRIWQERKDIEAWITWDIWHIPLRTEAKLVSVSKDYRIFRQCSVALTRRGRDKALAGRFVRFLASPRGARIFADWGWMTPPPDASPVEVRHDITVVCSVGQNLSTNDTGPGLLRVKRLVENYESTGVSRHELHISIVVHGKAVHWLLKDGPYRAFSHGQEGNPNKGVVQRLLELGVSVEACGLSMKENKWPKDDLLPGVTIVPGAYQRIIDLQLRGYAYILL